MKCSRCGTKDRCGGDIEEEMRQRDAVKLPEGWAIDRKDGDLVLKKTGDDAWSMRLPEETADTQMAFVTEFLLDLMAASQAAINNNGDK